MASWVLALAQVFPIKAPPQRPSRPLTKCRMIRTTYSLGCGPIEAGCCLDKHPGPPFPSLILWMFITKTYGLNQQMYADGGDVAPVGMGLPQSAAMPQLMSAAQFGYLNARTGGMIAGPGDGKSDDIPALLSNGEHVIDAATVSDLGNGDNDTGQKRLEEIKHKIRSSAGRKNPRKASPKQKGLGSLLNSARA
jgi:hypothetical protein